MAKIKFELNGDQQELLDGVNTLASSSGWTEKIQNPDYDSENPESEQEVDNPVSAMDACNKILWGFVADKIKGYNAEKGAEAGRRQAITETENRLVNVSTGLTLEE